MPFNGNTERSEVNLEEEVDEKDANTQANDQFPAEEFLSLQNKRIRFAGRPIESLVVEHGVSRPEQDPNCTLLHPGKLLENGDPSSSSIDTNGNNYTSQVVARPQVIIDVAKFSRRMDSPLNPLHGMATRPGVIVAPASSSNIGDLSINDDFAEVTVNVKKLVKAGTVSRPPEDPVVLLSIAAAEATSENLVSSTSGGAGTQHGILGITKRSAPYTERFQCRSFISTGQPRYREYPASENLGTRQDDFELGGRRSTSLDPVLGNAIHSIHLNGNSCGGFMSMEKGDAGDDEDLHEDDDSGELDVNDETDSAEEDGENEEDELTDSASEGEGNIRKGNESRRAAKPVITISDQNNPRLVIDFGETEVLEEELTKAATPLEQELEVLNENSRRNNNTYSILGSSNIPIENWVENAQRQNKRKRTDSEVVEDKA